MHQPLSYVHQGAKIAHNVVIEPFVTVMEGARIGKNCRIFPGSVISAIPQDLKFKGENSIVVIGNNVTIREFCTVNRGTIDKQQTFIDDNVLLMAYTHIAHDCTIGKNAILANSVNLAGHVTVGDWAIVGGLSGIHQFVSVGAHSMVSALSFVRKDVPPYTKAAREPLSYVGINSIGLRRRGFSSQKINEIQDIYRILFVRGYNTSQALGIIEAELPATQERDEILSFIRNSDRGIMKGYHR